MATGICRTGRKSSTTSRASAAVRSATSTARSRSRSPRRPRMYDQAAKAASATAVASSHHGSGVAKSRRPFSNTSGGYLKRNSQMASSMPDLVDRVENGPPPPEVGSGGKRKPQRRVGGGGLAAPEPTGRVSVRHRVAARVGPHLEGVRRKLQGIQRVLGVLPGIADVRVPVDHHHQPPVLVEDATGIGDVPVLLKGRSTTDTAVDRGHLNDLVYGVHGREDGMIHR